MQKGQRFQDILKGSELVPVQMCLSMKKDHSIFYIQKIGAKVIGQKENPDCLLQEPAAAAPSEGLCITFLKALLWLAIILSVLYFGL